MNENIGTYVRNVHFHADGIGYISYDELEIRKISQSTNFNRKHSPQALIENACNMLKININNNNKMSEIFQ